MAKSELEEFILNDIESAKGVYHPVKAGRLERMFIGRCACANLHPNPEDEFCDPAIGPNYGIISSYVEKFSYNMKLSLPIMDEPLIVRKLWPNGYMLLNGHHRWAAALRVGLTKVPVRIVNTALDSDIRSMLEGSSHDMRVTMDLDEVIFRSGDDPDVEKPHGCFRFGIHKSGLRLGIPALFSYLTRNGYDIWVYSSEFYSTDDVASFFKNYGVGVDGIITGRRGRKKKSTLLTPETEKLISQKYTKTIHIDNDLMVITRGRAGEFEEFSIDAQASEWAKQIINALEGKLDQKDHEQ